jgi:hypothetical protein
MEDMDIDALVEGIVRRAVGAAIDRPSLPSLGGKRKPVQFKPGATVGGKKVGGQFAPKGASPAGVLVKQTAAMKKGGPRGRIAADIEKKKAVRRATTAGIGSPNAGAGRGGAPKPDAPASQTRAALKVAAKDMQDKADAKPSDGSKKVVSAKSQGGQASKILGFNSMRAVMNSKLAGENSKAASVVDAALATVLNPNKGDMNPDAIRGAIKTANRNAMQRISKMKIPASEKSKLQTEVKSLMAQVRSAMETDIKGRVRAQKVAKKANQPGKKKTSAPRSGKTGASVGQPRSSVGDARRDPDIPDTGGKRKAPVARMKDPGSSTPEAKAARDARKPRVKPAPGVSYTPPKKKKKIKESVASDIVSEFFKSRNL